jgi:hypothetical protein
VSDKPFIVKQPLLIAFEQEGHLTVHMFPQPDHTHEHYALLIADLVRHVSRAFKVDEEDVWHWVEKERNNPTTTFSSPS